MGRYLEAIAYQDSIITSEREFNEIKNGRIFENSKAKFEIQNYKHEIETNEAKRVAERKIFYAILAIIIAIVTIVLLVLYIPFMIFFD